MPDSNCYDFAICIGGESGKWKEALEVLVSMRGKGFRPSPRSYDSTISACENGGEQESTRSLVMIQQADRAYSTSLVSQRRGTRKVPGGTTDRSRAGLGSSRGLSNFVAFLLGLS